MKEDLQKNLMDQQPPLIRKRYQALCDTFPESFTQKEHSKIKKAFEFALEAHAGVIRKSGAPYVLHVLNVAFIAIKDLKLDSEACVAALVHDIPEDTNYTIDDIKKRFGPKVAVVVDGLTKIDESFLWYQSKQAENFQKLLKFLGQDSRIVLIKLADRLDNMRSLRFLPKTKQWRIASETKMIYVPIAHRLGLSKIKTELEDLYLKTVNPESYYGIAGQLEKKLEERQKAVEEFVKPIEEEMRKQGLTFRIKQRVKSIYSIYKKIEEKGIRFNEIYDLIAVRIILSTNQEKMDCWRVYGIVTSLYMPNNRRKRDWISQPRSNGYESLHITVLSNDKEWVEVQIRTERMHVIASHGIAAHWKYKEKQPNQLMRFFDKWLEEISQLAKLDASNSLQTMDNLNLGLYTDEIHVFSQRGNAVTLPKGATVLDFALETLDEQGLSCIYGYVNERQVPLQHILKNGDQVMLELDEKKELVDEGMLAFVVAPKALRILRLFFEKSRAEKIKIGEQQIQRKFTQHNLSYNRESLELFRAFIGEEITENIFLNLANKKGTDIELLVKNFARKMDRDSNMQKTNDFVDKKEKTALVGESTKDQYELASCCSPLPGEEIFGIVMPNQRVRIHSYLCKERNKLLSRYGTRMIHAWWYDPEPKEISIFFQATSSDQFTASLLEAAKEFDIQSLMLGKEAINGEINGTVNLLVKDIEEVNRFMQGLKNIKGIKDVSRTFA